MPTRNFDNPWTTEPTPGKYIAAASANQDSNVIKATPGRLVWITVGNVATTVRFLKLYNKATAPTSSDTPVMTILIPGGTAGTGNNVGLPPNGLFFDAGISFRMTTVMADSNATAVTAGDLAFSYGYI